MNLKIQTGTENEILRQKSKSVNSVDKKILKFIKDMEKFMKKSKGIGLAAPQVGVGKRIILVTLGEKKVVPMVNPEILTHSDITEFAEEGCLSIPGKWGQVRRYKEITVQFLDKKNQSKTLKLDGLNARIVQHEIDHLDGILFTDYLDAEDSALNVMSQKETEIL